MSDQEEPQTQNTANGHIHGNVVQSGSMRDVHVHATSRPDHRDPWLVAVGAVALAAGWVLRLVFAVLLVLLLVAVFAELSWLHHVGSGGVAAMVVVGFLAVTLGRTGSDLMGRQHHAWRQDTFAGQSALWLSMLALVLMVGHGFTVLVVPVGLMALATVAAAALSCTGGARTRTGLVVLVGLMAVLWFGPALWVLWASGEAVLVRLAGTLVLAAGVAVPVLAVTAMPRVCGGAVLRGWALGVVLALGLVWAAAGMRSSAPVPLPVWFLVSTACAVVVALVVSAILGRSA